MKNREYAIANWSARFGILLYGLLRYLESLVAGSKHDDGLSILLMSIVCVIIVSAIQGFLKKSSLVPLLTGVIITGFFIFGAFYVKDASCFYISMLCVVGIVCMYQNFRMLINFLFISIAANVPLFFTLFRDSAITDFQTITISAILYLYGFFFLIILTYRASVRETSANTSQVSFNSILNSTPNMMVIVDGMNKITYISQKMAEFADCPAEYAINRPILDLFDNFEVKLMFAAIVDKKVYFEDILAIPYNDEKRYFKVMCTPLEQGVQGMFIDVSDITATVMAKNEAEIEKENAVRANLSKSRFLATMSHEIRTPMNAIIGISQMQMARQDLPLDVVEANNKIYHSGHGLLGIINDILDMSKIETGKLELVVTKYDLPSLINDSVQLNIPRIGSKHIEFKLDVASNIPSDLYGDELKIKQILNNILSNAIKYTETGTITMGVFHERIDFEKIKLIFEVSDTGQGMTQDDVKALGEEFARFNVHANRQTEGTGLGMHITKRLINLMNGGIEIKSEYGMGSTFTISIPQKTASDEIIGDTLAKKLSNFTFSRDKQIAKLQIVREPMPYGKVLIVDDVETNLYVAAGLLKPYGIKVETVMSGFATLDLITEGNVYDIIFMDHMMPRMDGIEATERLRKMGYTAPIVALTANAIVGNDEMFKSRGFDDFISKPIDIRQMNAVLNKYVRDKNKAEEYELTHESIPEPTEVFEEEQGLSSELIEVFIHDASKAIRTLRETGTSDLKLFTTTAHSMKSACANVGNAVLSGFAKKLETAGREAELDYIDRNTEEFIKQLEEFCDNLKASEVQGTAAGDTDMLNEMLKEIAAACDEYDDRKANELIRKLEEYKWSDEVKSVIDKIREHVLHSEFEEAAATAAAQ
jgi:signal transduction histidine kinase/CheY-like chemotaxis protein/HPt (histidine-containing phosphotransfer) domain-containing protein